MRVPRQDDVLVVCRHFFERFQERQQRLTRLHNRAPHVQMHIERDLIVTAARGVQAFARVADRLRQRAFDIHVNIFQTDRKSEFAVFNRC